MPKAKKATVKKVKPSKKDAPVLVPDVSKAPACFEPKTPAPVAPETPEKPKEQYERCPKCGCLPHVHQPSTFTRGVTRMRKCGNGVCRAETPPEQWIAYR